MNKTTRKALAQLASRSPTGRLGESKPELQDLTWGRQPGKATILKHTAIGPSDLSAADYASLEARVLAITAQPPNKEN